MSWMSENYEKAALGGGAAVALALAFFGWSAASSVDENLQNPATGRGDNTTAVKGAEEIPGTISAMKAGHKWSPAVVNDRSLDLFTGIPLFAKRGEKDPVDLWTAQPIHPPIDNQWFLKYRIDIGFADSAERDPDGDGFSNLEEFQAKTDPSDPKSHPALIAKLSYVDQEKVQWMVRWSSELDDRSVFKCRDSHFPGKDFGMKMEDAVKPGEICKFKDLRDKKCPLSNRFKFVEIQERTEKNKRTGEKKTMKYAIMEDLKPNKKGDRFEVPRRVPTARLKQLIHQDRTAVFELKAAGHQGKTFKVEERTVFALPPGAKEKRFFLKEVTDKNVTVEVRDASGAAMKTFVIPKGGLPDIDLTTFKSE
jgi:hypothetical protein